MLKRLRSCFETLVRSLRIGYKRKYKFNFLIVRLKKINCFVLNFIETSEVPTFISHFKQRQRLYKSITKPAQLINPS